MGKTGSGMWSLGAPTGAGVAKGKAAHRGAARAHLAAQRLPPAGLPLRRFGPGGRAAGGTQRPRVGAAQQLQRRLGSRAVARGRRGRLLERQQAAAERRAAGLHGALPAVVGALGAREGPVFLRPEAHHARPAKAVAAVGQHRLAGRALAQGAGGLGGARGERQGGGRGPRRGRGWQRRGRRARAGLETADSAQVGEKDGEGVRRGEDGGALHARSCQRYTQARGPATAFRPPARVPPTSSPSEAFGDCQLPHK